MIDVLCPSGLKGRIRGMRVKDEGLFADRKLVKSGRVMSELIKSCWVETLDPGPYGHADANIPWGTVAAVDRTYLMIQIRIASYGKDYAFRTKCGQCEHQFGWEVDLAELDCPPMHEDAIKHLQTGEPYRIEIGDKKFACRVLVGSDEELLAATGTGTTDNIIAFSLAKRIYEINDSKHYDDIVAAIEELPASDGDMLMDATDDMEGGVQTMFQVECPNCLNVQDTILPFESGFFSKRKRFAR